MPLRKPGFVLSAIVARISEEAIRGKRQFFDSDPPSA